MHVLTAFCWALNCLVFAVAWKMKEDLISDKHSSICAPIRLPHHIQIALIQKVRDYCSENVSFVKVSPRIILLFYKGRASLLTLKISSPRLSYVLFSYGST